LQEQQFGVHLGTLYLTSLNMKIFFRVYRTIIILSFSFLSISVQAQKCNCPDFLTLKAAYDSSDDESVSYIQKLETSSNKICIAKSYEWRALDYMDLQNFDSAEIYFQKTEKIYKQSSCGDSIFLTVYKQWAQLYYSKGDFAKAQEFSFKLLKAI